MAPNKPTFPLTAGVKSSVQGSFFKRSILCDLPQMMLSRTVKPSRVAIVISVELAGAAYLIGYFE